jgi:hypothetical protein
VLLLGGVIIFLSPLTGADGMGYLPFVAPLLVIASALTALAAVAAASRLVDKGKRTTLLWSSWFLALELVFVVISAGFGVTFAGPLCAGPAGGDACAFVYGFPLIGISAILAIVIIVAGFGAAITGLSSAARLGKRGWFVAILTSLIAAVIVPVAAVLALAEKLASDPILQVLLGVLIALAPVLLSILTLILSLSIVRQQQRA